MTPSKAAIQLTHVWRTVRAEDEIYPVKCRDLAEALGIKVHGDPSLGDEFEAGLFIETGLKAIVYNERIREVGRKNFSIAHELGHYSLHKDRNEFRCSMADLTDMQPHPQNIEQEANLFAAMLLMPADDFRGQLNGKMPTLALVCDLADRYETTLTATSIRFIEMSKKTPLAMVRLRGNRVIGWSRSDGMKRTGFWLQHGQTMPKDVLFENRRGITVDPALWLNDNRASEWELTQSSIHMPYYDQTLILVHAAPTGIRAEWEEPDPTPARYPRFR